MVQVVHMAEFKNTWKILVRKCNGRRDLKNRWQDDIEMSLEDVGWWSMVTRSRHLSTWYWIVLSNQNSCWVL